MEIEHFKALGLDQNFWMHGEVNGRSNMELVQSLDVPEDAQYQPCSEAMPAADTPTGHFEIVRNWADSSLYLSTRRDVGLCKPARASTAEVLPVMVFNDGLAYADSAGPVRAVQVIDNLINAGDIPPLAAVFVMPGRKSVDQEEVDASEMDPLDMEQRSLEYDSLSPMFGEFLQTEILPFAACQLNVQFDDNPLQRGICGISSGGICAFNTAWHHPESFGLVMSHCGSFVNIRGGHNYPYLVRTTPRKPIRVFLTSGKKDGDILFGNWPLANQQMASALSYAGYDSRFEFGEGGHSLCHGGSLFADAMRWLWRS